MAAFDQMKYVCRRLAARNGHELTPFRTIGRETGQAQCRRCAATFTVTRAGEADRYAGPLDRQCPEAEYAKAQERP